MNLIFLSNYFNHHQAFLSDAFSALENVDYSFVSSAVLPEYRKKLGWGDEILPEYVCEDFLPEQKERCKTLINEAEVVICGSARESHVQKCIEQNKLVFRYAERPLKKREPHKYLVRLYRWRKLNPQNKHIYMLSASAFAVADYAKFGLFKNRTYKWGYFPETKTYDIDELMSNKQKNQILWCGRFIDWKHPDDAVKAAALLKADGLDFKLKLIGTGEMEQKLKELIRLYNLENEVVLLGSMTPKNVRKYMESSGIYLFTSDKQEGWGAVLNESMNSGCAVVASHAIGSVPFLLDNTKNGLVYKSGNVKMLYEKIKYLLVNPGEQQRLGKNAYTTIANEWNAEVAASRFVNLAEHIRAGEKYPELYSSGPCSKAKKIKDKWFYK